MRRYRRHVRGGLSGYASLEYPVHQIIRARQTGMGAAATEYPIYVVSIPPPPPPPPPKTFGRRGGMPVSSRTRFSMGDDITTPTVVDPTTEIVTNTRKILEIQKQEAANRKFALIIAGASALFAAAKLGLVAIPLIRKKPV